MFADNTRVNFNTSSESIFLVNKELDVAIISLQKPAGKQHLTLVDDKSVDFGASVNVMGFCQESAMLKCYTDFNLSKDADDEFFFYTAELDSGLTGAPVLQMKDKDRLAIVGVHNSYSSKDEFPSMATKISNIRNWLMEDLSVPDGQKGKIRELLKTEKYECEPETADEMPSLIVKSSTETASSVN